MMRKYMKQGGAVSSGVRRKAMSKKAAHGATGMKYGGKVSSKMKKAKTKKPRGTGIAMRGTNFKSYE